MVSESDIINVPISLAPQRDLILTQQTGFWLPTGDVLAWLDAMMKAKAAVAKAGDENAIDFYLMPPETGTGSDGVGKHGGIISTGIIGLPRCDVQLHRSVVATPLRRLQVSAASHQKQTTTLWLTSTSRLSPAVDPKWLSGSLLSYGDSASVYIWLPNIGLVVLEPQDRISIADLLCVPERAPIASNSTVSAKVDSSNFVPGPWTTPPDIPVIPDRIAGFLLIEDPEQSGGPLGDLAAQFGQNADDLWKEPSPKKDAGQGSKKPSLTERGMQWTLKKLEDWLAKPREDEGRSNEPPSSTGGVPRKPNPARLPGSHAKGGKGWGISAYLFQQLAKKVEQQRKQQLDKLLEMIKRDPDRALKFAIPLSGDGNFRGLAVPGSRLLPRRPDFSLAGLSGGGPADVWAMDYRFQKQLRESYLEMANREQAVGRHRRAAYIHAHLLGDYASAAAVLEQGGFYREAATLYQEKLKRPADAARCLALAGMLEQAVELYDSMGDYESIARIWEQAGREDKRREAYKRAIEVMKSNGRVLDAASLLNDKLGEREDAKRLLWEQWPSGYQALPAAIRYFEMQAQDNQHDGARTSIVSAVSQESQYHRMDLARLLKHLAKSYPSNELKMFSYDACRSMIAKECKPPLDNMSQAALNLLRELDEEDDILTRDCLRFQREKAQPKPKVSKAPKPASRNIARTERLERLGEFQLPSGEYVAIKAISNLLFGIRSKGDHVVAGVYTPAEKAFANRAYPEGVAVVEEAKIAGYSISGISHYHQNGHEHVYLHGLGTAESQNLTELIAPSGTHWLVSSQMPAVLHHCDSVLAVSPTQWFGLEHTHGSWHLKSCGQRSENLRYWRLPESTDADEDTSPQFTFNTLEQAGFELQNSLSVPRCLLSHIDGVPVATFQTMLTYGVPNQATGFRSASISGTPLCLATSAPGTRKRIVIGHSGGLSAIWPEIGKLQVSRICDEKPYTHVLWMPGGKLYATTEDEIVLFRMRGPKVESRFAVRHRGMTPLALVPLTSSICGIVYQDGLVEKY